jgi:pSer/pThr/pTyr-binding forkhead associated (FHA) protein
MIECPTCKHQHFVGTIYCAECGTRLIHVSPIPTISLSADQLGDPQSTKPTPPEGPALHSGALLGLRVIPTGEVHSLLGRVNFTIGRSIEGQAVIPDVNFAQYDAFDHGVSRLHAEIRLKSDGVYIVDLDSANGTSVNGERLETLKPKRIKHGDIIQLGRMRLQIISRYRG